MNTFKGINTMTIFKINYKQLLVVTGFLSACITHTGFAQIKDDFHDYLSSSASVDSGLAVVDGEVWVWGFRGSGQAGNGIRALARTDDAVPNKVYIPNENNIAQLETLKNIKFVVGGIYHFLALDAYGTIWGWGQNGVGEVGCHYKDTRSGGKITSMTTNMVRRNVAAPGYRTSSPAPLNAITQATGEDTTDYSRTYPAFPCRVLPKGVKAVNVAAGEYHSIALDSNGNVWIWGTNIYSTNQTYKMDNDGNLILDSGGLPIPMANNTGTNTPPQIVRLPGNEKARLVGAAYEGVFVVTVDNKIYSWGDNENGGLGFATPYGSTVQHVVKTPTRADKIERYAKDMIYIGGGNGFGNALLRDGSVIGWGDTTYLGMGKDYYYGGNKRKDRNYFPDLDAASDDGVINRPILRNVMQFNSRYRGAVAVTDEGSLYVWGWGGALLANGLPSEAIGNRIYGAGPRKVTLYPGSTLAAATAGGKEHIYYWDEQRRMFGIGYNAGRHTDMFNAAMPHWPGARIPYETFVETERIKNANK